MARPDDPQTFNFATPDYAPVLQARAERLARLRSDPALMRTAFDVYRDDPASFLHDWAMCSDPRVVSTGRSGTMPMLLMPRQREMIEAFHEAWRTSSPLVVEKSRDCGASWLMAAYAATMCLFYNDLTISMGANLESRVDLSGSPDCLFYKVKFFIRNLPREFRQGWNLKNAAHMRLNFPSTGSAIVGECGDQIGRGGRSSIAFLDEAAHIERPKLVDAALAANTDVRIDVSSVRGMANSFAERRHSGRIKVFTYHYRDDVRKGPEWAEKKRTELNDDVAWNAEYELNYLASVVGQLIKPEWVQAAVDAHKKLGLEPMGARSGAYDPADEGDANAFAARHGNVVTHLETWSGRGKTMAHSTEHAFAICDNLKLEGFVFDGDGLGHGTRGFADTIARRRAERRQRPIRVTMFRGSSAVLHPDRKEAGSDVTNKDRFANSKAQSWIALRDRFEATWRVVNGAKDVDPEQIISLSSEIKELGPLCVELSIPAWHTAPSGRIVVEKFGEDGNANSPNRADCIMMLMGKAVRKPMIITEEMADAIEASLSASPDSPPIYDPSREYGQWR